MKLAVFAFSLFATAPAFAAELPSTIWSGTISCSGEETATTGDHYTTRTLVWITYASDVADPTKQFMAMVSQSTFDGQRPIDSYARAYAIVRDENTSASPRQVIYQGEKFRFSFPVGVEIDFPVRVSIDGIDTDVKCSMADIG